jgi:polar amino acid transport system substrate-binding protein
MRLAVLLACWVGLSAAPILAQTQKPPAKADASAEAAAPARSVLRFLTDSDYPPFNYIDEDGALTGFNVDVARAVCQEMTVACDIRPFEWQGLLPALGRGDTDAVIASIAISPLTLAEADFSDRYYTMPARFAARRDAPRRDTTPEGLESRRVGVVKGTAHEAYLAAFFPDAVLVAFESEETGREALLTGEVELVFGDGHSLMFWLNGTLSQKCCEFRGGPFFDERYFGDGIGVAVRKGDIALKREIDMAIAAIRRSGRLEELYLRYFPLRVY